MHPFMCGLMLCDVERLPGGRLSGNVRGHGFMAESSPPANRGEAASGEDSSRPSRLLWSHPDAALLHRRKSGLPQPRRLKITWMRLDLQAGLALTPGQESAWGLGVDQRLVPAGCSALDALDGTELDALVVRADRLGVRGLVDAEEPQACFDYSTMMQGVIVDPRRLGSNALVTIDSYEVLGNSAEFDVSRLAKYPAMLRQRGVPAGSSASSLDPSAPDRLRLMVSGRADAASAHDEILALPSV